jgi:hypothetical protein
MSYASPSGAGGSTFATGAASRRAPDAALARDDVLPDDDGASVEEALVDACGVAVEGVEGGGVRSGEGP